MIQKSFNNNDLMKTVTEDIESYKAAYKPLKAGVLERMFRKKISPRLLHPNAEDEFSIPGIGPNYQMISNYKDLIVNTSHQEPVMFRDPVIVEKMAPDGYLIINGHHRWAAAMQMGLKNINARVVNLTHKDDIERMQELCRKVKTVLFDLDEIIFVQEAGEAEDPLPFPKNKQYTERIRKGVPAIFKALHDKGYDIWVYTSGYRSEEYLRKLFGLYDAEPDGIINGFGEKQTQARKGIVNALFDSYKKKVNIDLEGAVVTYPGTKRFEYFDIPEEHGEWQDEILKIIRDWEE